MNEKLNVGDMIKTGLILFAITAVLAGLLAFVNGKTAPIIAQNEALKKEDAMRAVLPEAAEFEEAEITDEIAALSDSGEIKEAYTGIGTSGDVVGACVITETSGYDIGINTVTGVDAELEVTGVEITSLKETPGLGAKAKDEDFREQYEGKTAEIGVSKTGADDKNIAAISGATKTSNGVTHGVNLALETAEILMKGGGK